jgi:predicted membrane-bound mannosyltransferase
VLAAYVLFSSFFSNPGGPLESILAFGGYAARGIGIETDHVHPWNFYLRMLTVYRFEGGPVWSEGLITGFGLIGAAFILLKRTPSAVNAGLARFLVFYTLLLTLVYSVIPYKTPWCILSFLHAWILLAGIGVAAMVEKAQRAGRPRLQTGAVLILLLVPVFGTYRTARRTVYRYAADYRNPYVYAHTAPDFMNLVRRIAHLQEVSPAGRSMYIQVVADPKETWPLPFYLRKLSHTGYWTDPSAAPAEPQPDIIIASPDYRIDPAGFQAEYYGLRADTLLAMYIRNGLWERFMNKRNEPAKQTVP